jgi:MOSC N-terminal beta barrel domain
MAIGEDVGSVATLWRFPVKSMGGEQLHVVEVTERGILGDRAYALIDKDTGKVVSAKSVRLFPNLLDCKAVFVEPPRRGGDLPAVQILLPNGMTIRSDAGEADRVLSALGQIVTLALPSVMAAAQSGNLSIGGIVSQVVAGGAGGAILTALIGAIKNKVAA